MALIGRKSANSNQTVEAEHWILFSISRINNYHIGNKHITQYIDEVNILAMMILPQNRGNERKDTPTKTDIQTISCTSFVSHLVMDEKKLHRSLQN